MENLRKCRNCGRDGEYIKDGGYWIIRCGHCGYSVKRPTKEAAAEAWDCDRPILYKIKPSDLKTDDIVFITGKDTPFKVTVDENLITLVSQDGQILNDITPGIEKAYRSYNLMGNDSYDISDAVLLFDSSHKEKRYGFNRLTHIQCMPEEKFADFLINSRIRLTPKICRRTSCQNNGTADEGCRDCIIEWLSETEE